MSHISTLKLEIQIKDVEKIKEKLKELGFTVVEGNTVNDYYGHEQTYNDILFTVDDRGRKYGITEDGRIIGDLWGHESFVSKLSDALTASVMASELEESGYQVDLVYNEEKQQYEINTYDYNY